MEPIHARPSTGRLVLGPWIIDLAEGAVLKHDRSASGLSPKAEALLLLLCRNAGAIVSREQIMETVWIGRVVEEAAISNAIWQIRKALGDDGKNILQTRAKRGYLLALDEQACFTDASPLPSSAGAAALSVRRPRWRFLIAGAASLALLAVAAWSVWRWQGARAPSFVLNGDTEMTVSVVAPPELQWLRTSLLRTTIETAYRRGAEIEVFQRAQTRNPFAGPHLQVRIERNRDDRVVAELRLSQGEAERRERFDGAPGQLPRALAGLLARALGPTRGALRPGDEALVAARLAEAQFDFPEALAQYRRALARDPALIDAKIGSAQTLYALDRTREAVAIVLDLQSDARLSAAQRCTLNVLLANADPDRVKPPVCEKAGNQLAFMTLDLRQVLTALRATQHRRKSPSQWLNDSSIEVYSLIRLQEWAEAETELRRVENIARQAGWEHGRVMLGALRAQALIRQGRAEDAVKRRLEDAMRIEALGDRVTAGFYRAFAFRWRPIVPGPGATERRRELLTLIDQARDSGSIGNEFDALRNLLALDRGAPERAHAHMQRLTVLLNQYYSSERRALEWPDLLDEILAQHQYRDLLAAIDAHQSRDENRIYALNYARQRAMARFYLDDIEGAVAAIEAAEKMKLDLSESGYVCAFAWLFVEARKPDRARALLKRCEAQPFDRNEQAQRGDYALFARARLALFEGEPERAWRLLQPRLEALLATPELTRDEAESLAFLARHAVAMPGADIRVLQQVSSRIRSLADLDGTSPALRFGAHVLRWRLCRQAQRDGCGPVLPDWAQEDRLEARLAQETAEGWRESAN